MYRQISLILKESNILKNQLCVFLWIVTILANSFAQVYVDGEKRNLAVTLYDWPETAPDFASGGGNCGMGLRQGFVGQALDAEGKPVAGTATCTPQEITKWFRTQNVAGYTNATCHDLEITYDDQGVWVADFPNFFPMDDYRFLDQAQTVANPWNKITSNNAPHNYSFTMEVDAEFVYQLGQTFDFRGDDDVFVFINNQLVVDIGGVHGAAEASVNLDTLGLIVDEPYSFKIFFAERQCCGSSFKMSTSIDLITKGQLLVDSSTVGNSIQYNIHERQEWSNGSCTQESEGAAIISAASNFTLKGYGIEDTLLTTGISFGGINIVEGDTSISINVEGIKASKLLESGSYEIVVSHKNDPTQSYVINFDIEFESTLSLMFLDNQDQPVEASQSLLGPYSKISYALKFGVFMDGVLCKTCQIAVGLQSSDSINIQNSNGNSINEITLIDGVATIWVQGQVAFENGWIKLESTAIPTLLEINPIQFEDLLVSVPTRGGIYDVDGDGVADSIEIEFNHLSIMRTYPDSIYINWGAKETGLSWDTGDNVGDSVSFSNKRFSTKVYTGNKSETEAFALGKFVYYIGQDRIVLEHPIRDKVGPVIEYGEILPTKSSSVNLLVYFSEFVEISAELPPLNLYEFISQNDSPVDPNFHSWLQKGKSSRMKFYSSAEVTIGDSLRINPEYSSYNGLGQASIKDLSGNFVHVNNPKREVIGETKVKIKSLDFAKQTEIPLDQDESENKNNWQLFLVNQENTPEENFKETQRAGAKVDLDLGSLLLEDNSLSIEDVYLEWTAEVYGSLGEFISLGEGVLRCTDELYQGDCTNVSDSPYLGWNFRSQDGRRVGAGVYILRIQVKIFQGDEPVQKVRHLWKMGVMR